jgi:transketolase
VYTEDYAFEIGKAIVLREPADVTLIATGSMVHESLEAAKLLDESGLKIGVINMHTIKPIDVNAIELALRHSKLIVTVEEHSVIGGLGSAVAEYKAAKRHAPPQLILGLPDAFDVTGEYRYLLERHGLVGSKIAQAVLAKLHQLSEAY